MSSWTPQAEARRAGHRAGSRTNTVREGPDEGIDASRNRWRGRRRTGGAVQVDELIESALVQVQEPGKDRSEGTTPAAAAVVVAETAGELEK